MGVENFNLVGNKAFCGEEASTTNIGYSYEITFPVHYENIEYCFDLPVSMNLGGRVTYNSGYDKKSFDSIAPDQDSLDYCTNMKKGNVWMRVEGVEN